MVPRIAWIPPPLHFDRLSENREAAESVEEIRPLTTTRATVMALSCLPPW